MPNVVPDPRDLAGLAPIPLDWGGLGAIRLTPDIRDYSITRMPGMLPQLAQAPQPSDFRDQVREIWNQGNIGACVAFSTGLAVDVGEFEERTTWDTVDAVALYHLMGGTGQNGVDSRATVKQCVDPGAPLKNGGLLKTIEAYFWVDQVPQTFRQQIMAALTLRRPVMVALRLPADFGAWIGQQSPSAARTTGYHQILAVGATGAADSDGIIAANSWGPGYGNKGFVFVSWGFLERDALDSGYTFAITTKLLTVSPPPVTRMISAASKKPDGTITTTGTLPADPLSAADAPLPGDAFCDQELVIINQDRAANGKAAVARHPALDKGAQQWATDMANGAPFSHASPDGSTFVDRDERAGYPRGGAQGENIASGFQDAASVMSAYQKSPGHWANILGPYTVVGLGFDRGFSVQDYGDRGAAPPPPPSLESITGYQDASGHQITVAVYAQPITLTGQFTVDTEVPRILFAGVDCSVMNRTATTLAITLPTFANGADYLDQILMIHHAVRTLGPELRVNNPAPHPDLSVVALTFDPPQISPGGGTTGTILLSDKVLSGAVQIVLTADPLSDIAMWDPKVAVYAGSDRQTFPITLKPNAPPGALTITATLGASQKSATLRIGDPSPPPPVPSLVSLSLVPATVAGGQNATGTVTLSGSAPATGVPIALGTDTPTIANAPVAVTVPAGATTAPFLVTTLAVTQPVSVQIRAVLAGITRTGTLSVAPSPAPNPNPILVMLAPSQDRLQCVASFGEALASGATIALSVTQTDGRHGSAQITLGDPTPPPVLLHLDRVTDAAGNLISRAQPGDKVSILGGGFGVTAPLVTIAGLKAAPVTWSDAKIVVAVPVTNLQTDVAGPVVVTVAAGSVTSSFSISIAGSGPNPPPPGGPTITSVSPAHAKAGASVIVSGSGIDSGCYIIFSANNADGGVRASRPSWNATAIAAIVPAAAVSGFCWVSRHSDGTVSNKLPFVVDGSTPTPNPTPNPTPPPGDALHVSLSGSDGGTGGAASPFPHD